MKELSFTFIKAHANKYPVSTLIKITGVSRAGYYKWLKRGGASVQDYKDEQLLPFISHIFNEHAGTYGRRRIKIELKKEYNLVISEKRISRIMEKYGLYCKIRRKRYKNYPVLHKKIPNILNRNFKANKPGIKFAIDITYIEVDKDEKKWAYLCAIKDLFNGEIVCYSIGKNQGLQFVLNTVKKLNKKGFMKGAILHSDQGAQFTNPAYITLLEDMNITQSMSRRANCWDNACIENFFGHLKCEMYHFAQPKTFIEVDEAVEHYIHYYNNKRVQIKLKKSPVEYRLEWKAA